MGLFLLPTRRNLHLFARMQGVDLLEEPREKSIGEKPHFPRNKRTLLNQACLFPGVESKTARGASVLSGAFKGRYRVWEGRGPC